MKLYIATTTLNLDNILSTESIAPRSFYKNRDYGYTSFCALDYMPNNVIIMFSKIPKFRIYDKTNDSYPMVLEVDIDEKTLPLKRISVVGECNIYSVDDVIRLNPFNCKILFFSPRVLNYARANCSDSMTNKLGDRFIFDLNNGEICIDELFFASLRFNDICDSYEEKVLQDNRLNKIKGFIFGFLLGISKSLSPKSAKLLKIQKRIYDIIATIKNNGAVGNNNFYKELIELDDEYRKNDPYINQCRMEWENYLKKLRIPSESLEQLLNELDRQNVIKNNFLKLKGLSLGVSLRAYGMSNLESYRDALMKHTNQMLKADNKINQFVVADVFDLDPTYETCMLAKEDEEATLFNKFIDDILWHGLTPTLESLRTGRFDIATEVTKKAKLIWESFNWKWDKSSAQSYMNDLRLNIKSFTPFNVKSHENIILQSIAVYILKGEDYESLIQLCEDSSIANYKYVLALWGGTIGYVKMPKSIILPLINSASFENLYKDILTLLYDTSYNEKLPHIQGSVFVSPQKEMNEECVLININAWQDKIRCYIIPNINRNKKQLLTSLDNAFVENGKQTDYIHFFKILNKYEGWHTKDGSFTKLLKSLVEHFCSSRD